MAKKSKKIEKETLRLIEGMSDFVKKKRDGTYKLRTKKKKQVRTIKRNCVHWTIQKGKEIPTVTMDNANPGHWKCKICGAIFYIRPDKGKMDNVIDDFNIDEVIKEVNQAQFFGVKMGGNADDTRLFLKLKALLPKFKKARRNLLKQVNKRQEFEDRKTHTDTLSMFDSYSGFNYRS